jgi:hypothetical protein
MTNTQNPTLSRSKALSLTHKLWSWLAENPERQKEDWPGWQKLPNFENLCPLCEFVKSKPSTIFSVDCDHCPLLSFWQKNWKSDSTYPFGANFKFYMPCEQNLNSPFRKWQEHLHPTELNHRKTFAQQIARAALSALGN